MPRIGDRIAGKLGNSPIGHHVRGKKVGEVLLSALFALIILALVGVWAAATAGYETTSVFSPNWNLTDNDHWYSKFIPSPPGPLCQPAFINPGATFRTTNGIFLWEMGKGFNVSAASVNNGSTNPKVNFNATTLQQYRDDVLDHCDVSGVSIDMDLFQATVTIQVYATCIDPKWPALLHTTNVYSIDQSQMLDQSLWFNDAITPDPDNNASISDPMNTLAADLWNRQKAVYLRSSEVLPRIRGLRMSNAKNCALEDDKRACFDAPLSLSNNTRGFFLYPNLTVATADNDEVNWNVTTDNFIHAIFAAARYDFGANMTTNLFVNATSRQQLIVGSDAAQLDNNTALMNQLDGAQSFLDSPEFPPPKISRIRTSYMCNVMKMKQTPSFVIAVMGMAFAIFGVVFAAAVAIVKKLTGRDLGATAPKAFQALSPITSISSAVRREEDLEDDKDVIGGGTGSLRRRKTDAEKGRHRSNSSADRSDGRYNPSRMPTPAPSYHLNARGNEAVYSPLNDRSSEAGGSGAGTPNPSSFTSLSGFAKAFADKLPFGSQLTGAASKVPGLPTSNGNNWLGMAGGAAAGAAGGLGAGALANHFSDKNKGAPDVMSNIPGASSFMSNVPGASAMSNIPGASVMSNIPGAAAMSNIPGASFMSNIPGAAAMSNIPGAAGAQTMFARPAQAMQAAQAQAGQGFLPNASEYVPFAYPETIREGGTTETTPTPADHAVQPDSHNPYIPAALAAGAGGLAGAGAAHALNRSGQQDHASTISAVPQRATSPGAPTGMTSPMVPTRVTSPGPPVGHTASFPSRVTSPGPPSGHTSSVPARVTSPGPPVGARSAGAPAHATSQGPPVGATHTASASESGSGSGSMLPAAAAAGAAGLAGAGAAAYASSPSGATTSNGPPVGSRSADPLARVTSPGPPVGHRSSVNSRVTSPGPPVGHMSSVPARVTSPGPPVGARSGAAPAAAAAPTILAPKPRRPPSPTWLAEQEAAAAARANPPATGAVTGAPAAPALSQPAAQPSQGTSANHSRTTSGSDMLTQTPDSASGMHSPLSQIQRSFMSQAQAGGSFVNQAQNQALAGVQSAQQNAQNALNTNNPFKQ